MSLSVTTAVVSTVDDGRHSKYRSTCLCRRKRKWRQQAAGTATTAVVVWNGSRWSQDWRFVDARQPDGRRSEWAVLVYLVHRSIPSRGIPSWSIPCRGIPLWSIPSQSARVSLPGVSLLGISLPGVSFARASLLGVSLARVSLPGMDIHSRSIPSHIIPSRGAPSRSIPCHSIPSRGIPFWGVPSRDILSLSIPSGVSHPGISLHGVSRPGISLPGVSLPVSNHVSIGGSAAPSSMTTVNLSVPGRGPAGVIRADGWQYRDKTGRPDGLRRRFFVEVRRSVRLGWSVNGNCRVHRDSLDRRRTSRVDDVRRGISLELPHDGRRRLGRRHSLSCRNFEARHRLSNFFVS